MKKFFKSAFQDMKDSAKAQHAVDKANFAAVKAESRASFEEMEAQSSPKAHKAAQQAKREAQLKEAAERRAAAEARIQAAKGDK